MRDRKDTHETGPALERLSDELFRPLPEEESATLLGGETQQSFIPSYPPGGGTDHLRDA